MTTFADLGLSDSALAAVEALGYTEPTPVQEQSIPLALEGRDMIAAAKTGTGKTAAFSLPSLDRIERTDAKKSPVMLVITPTRELAMQIQEVCGTIAKQRGLRVANVVGGVKIEPQIDRLARGVDVLIATPGRLIDLMNQKAVNLGDVQILVLDEADRMLDMGFLPSVRRIVEATPATRQTLLFSATIDKGVLDQVDAMLDDPAIVQIAAKGETADTVEQYIARVPHTLKPDLLAALLKERGHRRVIVFARTRHRADAACRKLKRAGYHAEAIHSDRSQNQRKRALDNFASGETDILVATDVLARGIDVDEVSYVVNYDVPTQAEDYVHRIGRTGRAGAEGFAVTFVSPENKDELAAIEKLIRRPIPEIEVAGFNLEEAAEAAAARATRANAKHDPELAQAAREHSKKEKRRAKEKERAEENASEARQRGTRKKQGGKSSGAPKKAAGTGAGRGGSKAQGRAQGAKNASPRKGGSDLRPGRAHRAAVAAKRSGKGRRS
ncbi:DEAD/DEAH box helicase [uncultured Adlercreutzia sp.]|uniref:DEAD/DEAH box helicase n=1 Tax=uncultured Adlercreutzia sp. TaxID=875803 RepID=UPI002675B06F|nr:DEAD/DEAH box helicase [uncultured Adlercreutzia sp.]